MKKIILLFAILSAGLITSCSKDDNNDSNQTPTPSTNGLLTAKVNGVSKTFKVTDVNVINYPTYSDIEIVAHVEGDPTNTFEMNLSRDSGIPYFIQYSETDIFYQPASMESFPVVVSENSTNKFKGTFSGTMRETDTGTTSVEITEGKFDLNL